MADLAALLEKEASAEIDAILSEARESASEIIAQAKEDADAIVAQKQRELEQQRQASQTRASSAAQLEASSMRLRAQHQAVEAVFAKVEEEVNALIKNNRRYQPVLKKLLDEAISGLEGGDDNLAQVIVNPEDNKFIAEELKKRKVQVDVVDDSSVVGGVKVKAKSSNMTLENSLPSRLQAAKGELASEVSRLLLASEG